MADPTITGVAGLQLSNNTFSASPPGSMSKAKNGVISQKGVFQPRNGQDSAASMQASDDLPFALTEFQGAIISAFGTSKTAVDQGLGYRNGSSITPYSGTYNPVGDNGVATDYARMHFCLASLFMHFCCASGPKVLETYNGTPRASGLNRMPDFAVIGAQPTSTQPGVIPYNSSVAYRSTLKRITSTGQILTSPPSNRFVVTNRYTTAAGGLSRTGTTVTVTLQPGADVATYLPIPFPSSPAGTFALTMSPADANFADGTYTITGAGAANQFTYTNVGAAVVSTSTGECNPGALVGTAVVYLPTDAIAGDVLQFWKSVATSNSSIEPSDDLYLCFEQVLTSGNISAGYVQVNDYTPQSVLRVPLYTNPSDGDGQGALGANFAPPVYLDVTNFDGRTLYLGTTGEHAIDLQILGVGGPDGIQNNDTITIKVGSTTKVYTFKTSPSGAGEIKIVDDGSVSYNIAWTSYFLVLFSFADLRALGVGIYAETAVNGFPGGVRLERFDHVDSPIEVKVSRPKSWLGNLQSASFTDSVAPTNPNGLAWGKAGQPEAVPVLNATTIGVPNYYGRRHFGLRNALIVLKEGDGIWSVTGSAGNYTALQISTANIIAPDCAGVFADSVWAYTDQGILRISDTGGTQCVSRPIETLLNAYAAELPDETYAWSFVVPYETERRILFFVPIEAASAETGGLPLLAAFAYSQATNAWTGPLLFTNAPISGLVSTGHKLWLGLYNEKFAQAELTEERKTGTYLDLADGAWTSILATTSDPLVVELSLRPDFIREGTGISQVIGGTIYRTKVAEVLGDDLFLLAEEIPWAAGVVTMYDPYPVEGEFLPDGSPGARKVLTRLFTLYKPESFSNYFGDTTLFTDQMQDVLPIPTPSVGFGLTTFGTGPFGNPTPMVVDSNPIAAKWVNAGQFFPGFRLDEVWTEFKLQGVGMQVDGASGPVGRGK